MDAGDLTRQDRECQGKVMDAEALAREDRECQGHWEAEYSYLEGADTDHLYDKCTKNPDHKNFIPVYKFGKEHLPEEYRDDDIVEYIRAVADLTVRVSVTYVSDKRPEIFPGTRKHYPGYKSRGKRRVTFGTGWVERVDMPLERNRESCLCQECLTTLFRPTLYARIFIQTASHVVYNQDEGDHTTCHLYFDNGSLPKKCPGVVSLPRVTVRSKQINRDICEMVYYTHDLDLIDKLKQQLDHKKALGDKISSKLPQLCKIKRRLDAKDKQPLVFIVSHPHGCSKQISFGHCTNIDMFSNDNFQYLYDTATCPGSSGGPVCMLQKHNLQFMYSRKDCVYLMEIHCGNFEVDKALNFCSVITGYPSLQMVTLDTLMLDDGTWDEKFTCLAEDVLHEHYRTCQKNPGHPNFFPAEGFSSSTLPPLYRTEEVMKFIKILSDITVRVTVKYVSKNRPETVPGTAISYPWSSDKGSNLMRVGSGSVTEVDIFKNDRLYPTCDCKDCKGSSTPRTEFANIYIDTAAHLVYDEQEAEHTTCDLFFESGEIPAFGRRAVTLSGTKEGSRDTKRDWCRLIHVTHDLNLAETIDAMMNVYDKCLRAMEEFDYFNPMESGKQNGRKDARGEIPLHLVVSHPHGAAKQISIGYYGNDGNARTGQGQLKYTSTTCPGSSGAPALQLGWETFYPYVEEM
ncbi:unnamed protein product [Candidula unifasciata]|uniref:Uncharacterized protein n=1 Tax=Candidula unifasciata TaxID=100452 RepID=A0A8S4A4G3_9EUPU|nr:unnamed protein product [Candidula unifasciata]